MGAQVRGGVLPAAGQGTATTATFLLDGAGHLVHIDFGFILEISPGGNMRFESAAFKLSHEMTQLLDPGGGRASAPFCRFQELCIRGFLAVRALNSKP